MTELVTITEKATEKIKQFIKEDNEGEPDPNTETSSMPVSIIIGSFKDMRNAVHIIRKANDNGYTTTTVPGPDGFTRVAVLQFEKITDARNLIGEIRGMFGDAWILAK